MSAHPIIPREVFFSYAEADEWLALELEKHLSVLKREGLITTWHKGQIGIGTNRDKEMNEHLSTASIILLLLSADFMDSDYCYSVEMSLALARHKAGEAFVIPVVLRWMDDWHNTPIGSLQALPTNGIPVTNWASFDEAWSSVARGIRSVLQDGKLPRGSLQSRVFPEVWNIPYPRNLFFTGQQDLLEQLARALQAGHTTAISQPQAISGLGGIVRHEAI